MINYEALKEAFPVTVKTHVWKHGDSELKTTMYIEFRVEQVTRYGFDLEAKCNRDPSTVISMVLNVFDDKTEADLFQDLQWLYERVNQHFTNVFFGNTYGSVIVSVTYRSQL